MLQPTVPAVLFMFSQRKLLLVTACVRCAVLHGTLRSLDFALL